MDGGLWGLREGSGEKQAPGRVQTSWGMEAEEVTGECLNLAQVRGPQGPRRTLAPAARSATESTAKYSSQNSQFGVGGRNLSILLKSQRAQPEAEDGSEMILKQ